MSMKRILSIFVVALIAFSASAKVVHIAPEAPRSQDNIRYALRDSLTADTIMLAAGTYVESSSIAGDRNIVIMAEEGAEPVVQLATGAYIKVQNGANIVVEGLKFDGATNGTNYGIRPYDASSSTLQVKGCEFYGFTKNIITADGTQHINSVIIEDCYFHDNTRAAVYFAGSSATDGSDICDRLEVRNTTIANISALSGAGAIDIRNNNANQSAETVTLIIDHCTFYNIQGYERVVQSYKSPLVTISNCIFAQPEAATNYATWAYGGTVSNCLAYNIAAGRDWDACPTFTGMINNADPLFVNAAEGNFTLGEGSPALTAATDGGALGDPRWVPAAPALPYVALLGEMNGWDGSVDQLVPAEDGLTASATVSLAMNNNSGYAFKLLVGSDLLSAHHDGSDWYGIGRNSAPVELNWNADNSDPIWLSMDVAGDYIFTYTFASNTLAITYPEIQHTYTVAGNSDYLFGTTWDPSNTDNDMIKQEDGTYKWEKTELTLATSTIAFKVCQDHDWNPAYPASDYELAISEGGIYTITITFNPEGNVVAAEATKTGDADVLPTVAMHGDFINKSWQDTENFTPAEDKLTASLTLNLAADQYEFGMRIGGSGNWTANGATLTREANSTDISVGSGNMKLIADVAGDYIFTYTFETNTLAVTFPTATGITNTEVSEKVVKMIENGQLIIIKNGVRYNAQGAVVK